MFYLRYFSSQVFAKAYVVQFHQENEQSQRDLGIDFYDEAMDILKNNQDNDLNDKKLKNLDSITVNREPNSDNELANKKVINHELDKNTILRFNQTFENYLKVSVGNDIYNTTKNNKIQLGDTTINKQGIRQYLLPLWKVVFNDRNNNGVVTNFIRATRSSSPTDNSGATSPPPIGTSFIYIETSSNNHGHERVFVSWERTNNIQITNITFQCK